MAAICNNFEVMIKFMFSLVLLSSISLRGQSGVEDPVSWHIYVELTESQSYDIHFDATISEEWMIYSTETPVGGPLPTELAIDTNNSKMAATSIKDGSIPKKEYEELFDAEVWKFKDKAKFIANVESDKSNTIVKGILTYMACNGRQCLPPKDVPFVVVLN